MDVELPSADPCRDSILRMAPLTGSREWVLWEQWGQKLKLISSLYWSSEVQIRLDDLRKSCLCDYRVLKQGGTEAVWDSLE